MNKKETEFNQNEYINSYRKVHYKKMCLEFKPEISDKIAQYCNDMDIKKSKFAVSAMMYIIDNNIPLTEYYRDNNKNN